MVLMLYLLPSEHDIDLDKVPSVVLVLSTFQRVDIYTDDSEVKELKERERVP